MWFSVISAGLLAIATSVTAASSITVYQTTACTSSTPTPTAANPFLVPNADDYPFRAGEVSYITWTPTTSDTISLTLDNGTQFSLAEDIPNTGYFEWTPDASLINANEFVDIFDNTAYVLLLTDGTTTSQSPSLYVLSPTYPADFYNISTWRYPTVGEPTTIIWSPSTASGETTITRQLVFGNGEIPGPSNTITIGGMYSLFDFGAGN